MRGLVSEGFLVCLLMAMFGFPLLPMWSMAALSADGRGCIERDEGISCRRTKLTGITE